jgi:hypothetical protein
MDDRPPCTWSHPKDILPPCNTCCKTAVYHRWRDDAHLADYLPDYLHDYLRAWGGDGIWQSMDQFDSSGRSVRNLDKAVLLPIWTKACRCSRFKRRTSSSYLLPLSTIASADCGRIAYNLLLTRFGCGAIASADCGGIAYAADAVVASRAVRLLLLARLGCGPIAYAADAVVASRGSVVAASLTLSTLLLLLIARFSCGSIADVADAVITSCMAALRTSPTLSTLLLLLSQFGVVICCCFSHSSVW